MVGHVRKNNDSGAGRVHYRPGRRFSNMEVNKKMKVKLICPWCGSTDIEPVGGIAGSVSVRCERCGFSTGYYDAVNEAVDELNNIACANIGINTQNAVQGKIGGQEANGVVTLCTGNGGQENG